MTAGRGGQTARMSRRGPVGAPVPPVAAPARPHRRRARPGRVLRPRLRRRRPGGAARARVDVPQRPQLGADLRPAAARRLPRARDGPARARPGPARRPTPFRLQDCADDAAGVLQRARPARRARRRLLDGRPGDAAAGAPAPGARAAGSCCARPPSTGATRGRRCSGGRWAACGCCSGCSRPASWRAGLRAAGTPSRRERVGGRRAGAGERPRPRRGRPRARPLRQQRLGRAARAARAPSS